MAGLLGALGRAWRYLVDGPAPSVGSLPLALGDGADVAFHVAWHEANSRHQPLSSLHLLYGLLQDDGFVTTIAGIGGDPTAIEHRVLEALDSADPVIGHGEALRVLSYATASAASFHRLASCTDLWARLATTDAARLVEAGGIQAHDLLFAAVHGGLAPAVPSPAAAAVDVVMRNDDVSTKEFVVDVLRDIFELAPPRAVETMEAIHGHGWALVGRFATGAARDKVVAARARARDHGFPLWIAIDEH